MTTIQQLKTTFSYAMHGNGAYKGLRQTNTLEALEHWYAKGVRIFEIDMARTSDGDYVAVAHYLNRRDLRRLEIFDIPEQCTRDWFMSQKLFSVSTSGLTPLSLESIVQLLREKKDIIVILDLFGLFQYSEARDFTLRLQGLIKEDSLWDRILIESYSGDMTEGIQAVAGCANIMACVRSELNENSPQAISPEELLSKNVQFVSYPWHYVKKHPGELASYSRAGITIVSRTKSSLGSSGLRTEGAHVNLVANRFSDGWLGRLQWAWYMLSYVKRIFIKVYIRIRY